MVKKKKKKYYAIKEGIGVKDIIVETWEECKELVHGYNAVYKSFLTMDEAKEYLNIVDAEKVKEKKAIAVEIKKKKQKQTKVLKVTIPTDVYNEFEHKCNSMNMDKDTVIKNMLVEWIV